MILYSENDSHSDALFCSARLSYQAMSSTCTQTLRDNFVLLLQLHLFSVSNFPNA